MADTPTTRSPVTMDVLTFPRPAARAAAAARTPRLVLLVLVAVAALVGCGEEERPRAEEREGIGVVVGGVRYAVPLSRQLNPLAGADRDLFEDVPPPLLREGPDDELWYGVFLRAEPIGDGVTGEATFRIEDTQENVFRPVTVVEGDDGVPGERVLLFRLPRFSLDNRPLELVVDGRGRAAPATITLDV